MTLVMSKAKWLVPLLVIVAMLAAVGIVWGTSGGSDGAFDAEFTKINPAYENVLVIPPESTSATVLYSIEVSPESAMIAADSGDVMTIVVTNLTAADGTGFDISGNVVVEARTYSPDMQGEPILTLSPGTTDPISVVTFTDITVHPEKAVTFQVPVRAMYNSFFGSPVTPQGMVIMYKAYGQFVSSAPGNP